MENTQYAQRRYPMRGQPGGDDRRRLAQLDGITGTAITGPRGNHVMTRTEQAIQRRRMTRKIRETVALRRFTATLSQRPAAEPSSAEQADTTQPPTN